MLRAASLLSIFAFCVALSAQNVTTEVVNVGGLNASGSEGGNPPTLSDGTTVGTAELTFTYNQSTCDLTVVVKNTSPVVTGGSTPVITRVFFNLPQFAVGNICLVSQNAQSLEDCSNGYGGWGNGCNNSWGGWGWNSGCNSGSSCSSNNCNNGYSSSNNNCNNGYSNSNNNCGGGWGWNSGCNNNSEDLDWDFAKDTNLENGSALTCDAFGGFGVRLKSPGGTDEAIANPAAGCNSSCDDCVGTATFVFHLTGQSCKNLTAAAFTRSLSSGTDQVNVAVKFRTEGYCNVESACIGNDEKCSSGGWVIGVPRIGQSVYAVETAADGCYGCIICSTNPGPTTAFGITVPVGTPYTVILSQLFPNASLANVISVEIPIPNDPAFIGVTYYCATVIVDEATQTAFDISPGYQVTVLPPLN